MIDIDDYTSNYEKQYGEGPGWFEQVLVEARRAQVLGTIGRHPHARILEVGCGLDPLSPHVTDADEFTVVEPSARFCDAARQAGKDRSGYRVVQGFLEDCASALAENQRFDLIIVSSLLHEVSDADRLLDSVSTLCDAETVVHLNVPNVMSFHRLLALEMGVIDDLFVQSETEKKFQRQRRFDRATFLKLLEEAGFHVLRFETYFIKPFSHAQMEAVFDKGILPRAAIDGLARMGKYLPELGAEMFAEVRLREEAKP